MKYKILVFILFAIIQIGCEETLDIEPESSLTFKNALNTPKDFESALNATDHAVKYMICNYTGEDPGNQVQKGWYTDEVQQGTYLEMLQNNSPEYILNLNWKPFYDAIACANVVLHHAEGSGISKERSNIYRGQAYFYKALAYLELLHTWGDCILIRDEIEFLPTPKSEWTEVADYAIEQAQHAIDLLPEFEKVTDWQGNSPRFKSTPCKGAANALLAHLCAWKAGGKYFAKHQDYDEKELWERAEKACSQVIGSGTYELVPNAEAICTDALVANSKESVYETVFKDFWNESSGFMNGAADMLSIPGFFYHCYPLRAEFPAAFIKYIGVWIHNSTVREMYSGTDERKYAFFYQLDEMDKPEYGGYAFPNKWRLPMVETSGPNVGKTLNVNQNKIWWRLADIYLLRAECRSRLGGEYTAGAIDDLNKVRERSKATLYNASEYGGDLRYTIFKEREKELIMEGQRYYDIIRNGYVRTELAGEFKTVTDQDLIDGALFCMISKKAFSQNPLLRQNTYWHRRL